MCCFSCRRFLSVAACALTGHSVARLDLEDVAKAALRDLDVEVDLKERWRGQNPGISS